MRIYRANSTEPETINCPSELKDALQEGVVKVERKVLGDVTLPVSLEELSFLRRVCEVFKSD